MSHLRSAKLTYRDYHLLLALREHASLGFAEPDVIDRITRKLADSESMLADETCARFAQIGSLVTFCLDERLQVCSKLVLSPRVLEGPGDIPITTALGMALLGMSEGSVPIVERQKVSVTRVVTPHAPGHQMANSWHEVSFADIGSTG